MSSAADNEASCCFNGPRTVILLFWQTAIVVFGCFEIHKTAEIDKFRAFTAGLCSIAALASNIAYLMRSEGADKVLFLRLFLLSLLFTSLALIIIIVRTAIVSETLDYCLFTLIYLLPVLLVNTWFAAQSWRMIVNILTDRKERLPLVNKNSSSQHNSYSYAYGSTSSEERPRSKSKRTKKKPSSHSSITPPRGGVDSVSSRSGAAVMGLGPIARNVLDQTFKEDLIHSTTISTSAHNLNSADHNNTISQEQQMSSEHQRNNNPNNSTDDDQQKIMNAV